MGSSPLHLRNYYQIKDADQVIAVSEGFTRAGDVKGGTGVGVKLAIQKRIPGYILDQGGLDDTLPPGVKHSVTPQKLSNRWFVYDYDLERFRPTTKLPTFSAQTAAIGTRDLNSAGKKAIESLFEGIPDRTVKKLTPQLLKKNPNKYYLFGDNLIGKGKAGQAIIRDMPNAIGIPTKKLPSMKTGSFFTDAELAENKIAIDKAFEKIPKGATVVIPEAGLGTGFAELDKRAPKTFEYLNEKIKILHPSKGILHSGGAEGADTLFEKLGMRKGFEVQAHSFEGHYTQSTNRVIHSIDELKAAQPFLDEAATNYDYALKYLKSQRLRIQMAGAKQIYLLS